MPDARVFSADSNQGPGLPPRPTCSSLRLDHLCAGFLDPTGEGGQLVLGKFHLGGALQAEGTGAHEQAQAARPHALLAPVPWGPGTAATWELKTLS